MMIDDGDGDDEYDDHKMVSSLVFRATPLPSVNVTAGMLGLRTHLDHG